MLWHFFMVHDDWGNAWPRPSVSPPRTLLISNLSPRRCLTSDEQKRVQNLGSNGDKMDAAPYGKWTGSIENKR